MIFKGLVTLTKEETSVNIIVFDLTRPENETRTSHTRKERSVQ